MIPARTAVAISESQTAQACAMEAMAIKRTQTRQRFFTEGFAAGRGGRCSICLDPVGYGSRRFLREN